MASKAVKKALEMAKAMSEFSRGQAEPAAQALQATIEPLKQRYTDLIASIKGNQQVAENRQTVTTNNELGKRGILGSSGVAQQEMTNALNPITSDYSSRITDTSNQQSVDLANIASQIAGIRSGAAQTGIGTGINLYNSQQSLDAQKKSSNAANALALQNYQNILLPESKATVAYNNALTQKTLAGNLGGGDSWS